MTEAAAPAQTEANTQPQAEPEQTGKAAKPSDPEPQKSPPISKVEQLRAHLRQRREADVKLRGEVAKDKGIRTRAQRDADAAEKSKPKAAEPDADAGADKKAAKTAESEKAAEDKAPAKTGGAERDEHGRFIPKDGGGENGKSKPDEARAKEAKEPARDEPKDTGEAEQKRGPAEAKEPEQKPVVEQPKPPEAKPEPDKRLEHRLARMTLEMRDKDAALVEAKAKAKRADELEALIKRVQGAEVDDDAFAQLNGRTFEQLVKELAEGKSKYRPVPKLPPEMQRMRDELAETLRAAKEREEKIAKAERERQEAEDRAKAEAEREEIRKRELEHVRNYIDGKAEKYPVLASSGTADERVLTVWYDEWEAAGNDPGKQPDLDDVADKIESALVKNVSVILSSERGLRKVLSDPKVRDLAAKILGQTPAQSQQSDSPQRVNKGNQQAASDGPRTLSKTVTQEVPALSDRPATVDEKRARQLEALQRFRAARVSASR